jgi:predicted DNA-binding protein (MmcQ/YjbR family)
MYRTMFQTDLTFLKFNLPISTTMPVLVDRFYTLSRMNIESFRTYCMNKKGVSEGMPFDTEILVFKVMGKMFALTNITLFSSVNLKCDPENAVMLREQYDAVRPGYHMSKTHWNTIEMDDSISDQQLQGWIDDSYNLVVAGLSKKLQEQLRKNDN